jgi:hypothetical protein
MLDLSSNDIFFFAGYIIRINYCIYKWIQFEGKPYFDYILLKYHFCSSFLIITKFIFIKISKNLSLNHF